MAEIDGLRWEANTCVDNGGGSFVVPLPTTHLVHLVFHGEEPFSHGQYGIHRGLEDRLTFLGPATQRGRGYFLDCRRDSPTMHNRLEIEITPSAKQTLRVPCGVAHCFDGLEGVFTLNSFRAYLPPPDVLLTEANPWSTGADIVNFPMDARDDELPIVDPNPHNASARFYELLSAMQAETLGDVEHEYPVTEDVRFPDGSESTLMIRKPVGSREQPPEWEQIDDIEGLGWRRHLLVWSSDVAGYAALTDTAPLQVIDHGTDHYATDAYGIHLEWEDRLTFVGPSRQTAVVRFIDCREDSPTFRREAEVGFQPSALRYLQVPSGVAHAFDGLENIFTVNRPVRCAGPVDKYDPGNDVIDWPLAKRPAPAFRIEKRAFPYSYYENLATMQREYLATREQELSTASVLLVEDDAGDQVRVALRAAAQAVE